MRCFVRLSDADGRAAGGRASGRPRTLRRSKWTRRHLPVSNLAAREERTVVDRGHSEDAPELLEPVLGGLEQLRALGTRAAASTPIVVQGRSIGVLTRASRRSRASGPRAISRCSKPPQRSAVSRFSSAGSCAENRERLGQQAALLRAAQVLSGELDLETGARSGSSTSCRSCSTPTAPTATSSTRSVACCAAPPCTASTRRSSGSSSARHAASPAVAIREGRAVIGNEYGELDDPVPHRRTRASPTRSSRRCAGARECTACSASAGEAAGRSSHATPTCSRRSPVSPRSPSATPRRSRRARGRRASSAASIGIASVLGQSLSRSATLEAVAQAAAEALGGALGGGADAHGRRLVARRPPRAAERARGRARRRDRRGGRPACAGGRRGA